MDSNFLWPPNYRHSFFIFSIIDCDIDSVSPKESKKNEEEFRLFLVFLQDPFFRAYLSQRSHKPGGTLVSDGQVELIRSSLDLHLFYQMASFFGLFYFLATDLSNRAKREAHQTPFITSSPWSIAKNERKWPRSRRMNWISLSSFLDYNSTTYKDNPNRKTSVDKKIGRQLDQHSKALFPVPYFLGENKRGERIH